MFEEGASACKDCSSNFYCPTGSPYPIQYETINGNSTVQPKRYKAQDDLIEILRSLLIILVVFLFFLAVSLVIFVDKFRDLLG